MRTEYEVRVITLADGDCHEHIEQETRYSLKKARECRDEMVKAHPDCVVEIYRANTVNQIMDWERNPGGAVWTHLEEYDYSPEEV